MELVGYLLPGTDPHETEASARVKPEVISPKIVTEGEASLNVPPKRLNYDEPPDALDEFFVDDETNLQWELQAVQKHVLFPQYMASIEAEVDDDYVFLGVTQSQYLLRLK